jgi:hypothetical protein
MTRFRLFGSSSTGRPQLHGPNLLTSQILLALFLLGYFVYILGLERVTYTLDKQPWFWLQLIQLMPPLAPYTDLILEPASWLNYWVLRHFIPVAAGYWLGRKAIVAMLWTFYDLPNEESARALLERLQASRMPFLKPVAIRRETFTEDRKKDPVLRIGGPARILVNPGDAVATESNGRMKRVLGPGVHGLQRFEYPQAVVDVRPQEREKENVNVITSDGIELTTDVSATFQIDSGGEEPTRETPFPFQDEAVQRAAYAETDLGDDKRSSWESLAINVTAGKLKDVVAEMELNQLILPQQDGSNVHQQVQSEMENRARGALRSFGIHLRDTRLGSFQLPEEIKQQNLKYWQAYWDRLSRLGAANSEAQRISDMELARAEAEAVILQAIVEAMQRARRTGKNVTTREVLALRMIEVLETMAQQSQQVLAVPSSAPLRLGDLRQEMVLRHNLLEAGQPDADSEADSDMGEVVEE